MCDAAGHRHPPATALNLLSLPWYHVLVGGLPPIARMHGNSSGCWGISITISIDTTGSYRTGASTQSRIYFGNAVQYFLTNIPFLPFLTIIRQQQQHQQQQTTTNNNKQTTNPFVISTTLETFNTESQQTFSSS